MIFKKIEQLKTLFSDLTAYRNHKKLLPDNPEKAVLVQFQNPQLYHRFFYLLLKFYHLAGYTVYFPMSFSLYRNLRNKDRYMALLLQEKNLLSINSQNKPEEIITLTDSIFSADYFKDYFENNNDTDQSFHIPMSFHPYMYHQNLWNQNIHCAKERFNSIFCYGNFDAKAYLDIEHTGFNVIPRTKLLSFFSDKSNFLPVRSKKELISADTNYFSEKFVFAIKENYQIDMDDIRSHLSLFNFFLCCPGVVMPLCHNVVEAMSVGTIPVIEKEYAEVMYPHLEHQKNAIIFHDLEDLELLLNEKLFTIPKQDIEAIRKNVLDYYQEFLSPKGMINNLNQSIARGKKIYLQAEHRSVKFNN
ncbi:hypothetical protein [Chryseobacterium sp. Leaf394]|uniref:hypothetical protein n=1 Tax=Chryseobacterium sp. Leaf394 TaxID=1736361 RepID=UPI0006F39AA5|nr:hypothetical protein [Chryseobacterium sp. Leaf394]KQS95229.1 hypothetical protein ASG21_17465 [Chryseobacterium sp. Leaf394]